MTNYHELLDEAESQLDFLKAHANVCTWSQRNFAEYLQDRYDDILRSIYLLEESSHKLKDDVSFTAKLGIYAVKDTDDNEGVPLDELVAAGWTNFHELKGTERT